MKGSYTFDPHYFSSKGQKISGMEIGLKFVSFCLNDLSNLNCSGYTVKLGDKEQFDKEQIGFKIPFLLTNCQFTP
jgi:hypothetical protein